MHDRTPSRTLAVAVLSAAFASAPAATGQEAGAVLYDQTRLSGQRLAVSGDVFDLSETGFGARRASSVDVAPGCRVTLYELSGYRGLGVELTAATPDLGVTRLGRRSVASLRLECSRTGAPGWGEGGEAVTLFRDVGRKGPSQAFLSDVPDLRSTSLGARQASSIEVPDGCSATLYSEPGYRGRSTTFRATHDDLRRTGVGNDAAASLRVDCVLSGGTATGGPGAAGRGVTLFRDVRRTGPSQSFLSDVPDLGQTLFGSRQASSLEVSEGCVATLFAETGYRGRSTAFRAAHDDLRRTDVGNDSAASLRVECAARPRRLRGAGTPAPGAAGLLEGVTLYRDKEFRGESASFRSDVPDLSRTTIGALAASSLRVPPGCRAILYSETGYRGRSSTFDAEHADLRGTSVGNDAARSMRVACGTRAW